MCGISGIFHFNQPDCIEIDRIKRMISVLDHRGPDDAGIYVDKWAGLGHTRLSIIDLSCGHQPIHNENKTLWIVYNGEVYNYPELRQDLLLKGHRFYTSSDTEVILHLYEEYGQQCLGKLNGQFAFAIWDSEKKEMFIARDRVGIKPLYYTLVNDRFIFSSEIKSIFMCEEISRQIDPVVMDQIFTFWSPLPGYTPFKGVKELLPGHYMKISKHGIKMEKYWEIPHFSVDEQLNTSPDLICEEIKYLLLEAVKLRLRADVPVGCYLSGGIDSSALASLVVNNFNNNVKTFAIRFKDLIFDEGQYQKKMVSYLNTDHKEIVTDNHMIGSCWSDVIWHSEKPLLRTAPVPLYFLSKLVRHCGLKVVLTGEGADEVFGGYNIFREAKVRRFWARQKHSQRRADLIGYLYPYIFNDPKLRVALQSFFAKGLDRRDDMLFSHFIRWSNTSRIKTFFSSEVKDQIADYDAIGQLAGKVPYSFNSCDYLSRAQYIEMSVFMSNYLLSSQGDRMAMANSVEIRLPYLDHNLIEFMAKVPAKWKILGINEKHLLKKSFKSILPTAITTRSKHPYRASIKSSLLNSDTKQYTEQMLCESAINKAGLFEPAKVQKLLNKLETSNVSSEIDNMAIAAILSSQILYNQFIEDFSSKSKSVAADKCNTVIDHRYSHLKDKSQKHNLVAN